MERELSTNGWDPHAVSVKPDAVYRATKEVPTLGKGGISEAERVEQRDRTSSHREYVTKDTANAGCGALEGLDERWVVVALNFKDNRFVVADVDHTGVLARSNDYVRTCGWKGSEMNLCALVGTVFRKKRGADAQLDHVYLTPERGFHRVVFRLSKTVFLRVLGGSGASPGGCVGHRNFLLSAVRAKSIPGNVNPQSLPTNRGAFRCRNLAPVPVFKGLERWLRWRFKASGMAPHMPALSIRR